MAFNFIKIFQKVNMMILALNLLMINFSPYIMYNTFEKIL
jgi:hypothetical protein